MDDMAKAVDQRSMESSTPILEISAVVPMSKRETREMEGGSENAKDKAMAKDDVKEGKAGSRSGQNTIWPERKSNQTRMDSVESRSVEPDPDGSQSNRKSIGRDRSGRKLSRSSPRSKWLRLRHPISKQSRLVNTRNSPSKRTTTDDKGKANLKDVIHDEILTKKEGSKVKMVNSKARLYDEGE